MLRCLVAETGNVGLILGHGNVVFVQVKCNALIFQMAEANPHFTVPCNQIAVLARRTPAIIITLHGVLLFAVAALIALLQC